MTKTLEPAIRPATGEPWPVLDDLAYLCSVMVNVYFVGPPHAGDREWVLVDAGLFGSANRIARAAEARFGPGSRPSAIILTHGHFDHVGALETLAWSWDVPAYAHTMELPYLTGRSSYPPPDPSVGGGIVSTLSWTYPRGPVDLGGRVSPLPEDGSVPGLPGWRWILTPGHTPGHVALFRDADRTLIAGDAFVTTKQESALAVMAQRREVHGPPMYFTPDWGAAARSVAILADLDPEVAATGHGDPLRGGSMRSDLHDLARDFRRRAIPRHGRYVNRPAVTDENGVVDVPPDVPHIVPPCCSGSVSGSSPRPSSLPKAGRRPGIARVGRADPPRARPRLTIAPPPDRARPGAGSRACGCRGLNGSPSRTSRRSIASLRLFPGRRAL